MRRNKNPKVLVVCWLLAARVVNKRGVHSSFQGQIRVSAPATQYFSPPFVIQLYMTQFET